MQSIVTIHLYVGLLVLVSALALVWRLPGRRITLYVLTVQILLGIALVAQGYRISPIHIVAAVLGWALYMAANAIARRNPEKKLGLYLTIAATVLVVVAGAIGGAAMPHPSHHM
jgi:hypothetical protein